MKSIVPVRPFTLAGNAFATPPRPAIRRPGKSVTYSPYHFLDIDRPEAIYFLR